MLSQWIVRSRFRIRHSCNLRNTRNAGIDNFEFLAIFMPIDIGPIKGPHNCLTTAVVKIAAFATISCDPRQAENGHRIEANWFKLMGNYKVARNWSIFILALGPRSLHLCKSFDVALGIVSRGPHLWHTMTVRQRRRWGSDALTPGDATQRHIPWASLNRVMAWCHDGIKPLPESMLTYHTVWFTSGSVNLECAR